MSDSDNTTSIAPANASTRPYLVRAMYEWCSDNSFTPFIAVYVDASVQVPREFVKDNEIVLNVGMDATSDLPSDGMVLVTAMRILRVARVAIAVTETQ